jgi:predicted sulfurtransferase
MSGQILLFYQYTDIENPELLKQEQETFCKAHHLTGRIIIAQEGINGTLGGSLEETEKYITWMKNQELFKQMPFKTSKGGAENFPKLSVKVKKEIVNLGLDIHEVSYKDTATHLSPEAFHQAIALADENTLILDGRNAYEARVGRFTGALVPPVNHAREFSAYVDQNLETFKDKKVLMYCTGGVRCERESAYMLKKGIKEVYQLEGGIHEYLNTYPDGYFRGINYVFDSRIGTKTNNDIVGNCDLCNQACETFTNCRNASCNKHFICCESCTMQYANACSSACKELLEQGIVKARPALKKIYEHKNI